MASGWNEPATPIGNEAVTGDKGPPETSAEPAFSDQVTTAAEPTSPTDPAHVLPRGFLWGAVRAGIKASGSLDLAAAFVTGRGQAAVSYTGNAVVAAPITVGREHLAVTSGKVSALLVNAGNANCATGAPGLAACRQSCVAAAEALGCIFDEVLPSSTGIIGVPFPIDTLIAHLPALREAMGDTIEHAEAFADAILTTDTRRKIARAVVDVDDAEIRLLGICKGAGMIAPLLGAPVGSPAVPHATMLVYLFTDLSADAATLRQMLEPAVERSFNSISIDGDTSTNDTVVLLASSASGIEAEPRVKAAFADALDLVCQSLARQIVADGEGVGHVVELHVQGAVTVAEARQVARTIANSPLCKTAWSSADPNWGRLLAAAGRSGVPIAPEQMRIALGGVEVFRHGQRVADYDEIAAHTAMQAPVYTIDLDLGRGEAECRFLTCDLTAEYVRINADYST